MWLGLLTIYPFIILAVISDAYTGCQIIVALYSTVHFVISYFSIPDNDKKIQDKHMLCPVQFNVLEKTHVHYKYLHLVCLFNVTHQVQLTAVTVEILTQQARIKGAFHYH